MLMVMVAPSKRYAALILLLTLLIILAAGCYTFAPIIELSLCSLKSDAVFTYEFRINDDGNAHVRVVYSSSLRRGVSWILVPRFIDWVNRTIRGSLIDWTVEEPEKYTGSQYYFYKVLSFSFLSESAGFEIAIEYDFPLAAIFVESESTHGIFYSPQIGFEQGCSFKAIVIFPARFKASVNEAVAIGKNGFYRADKDSNSSHIFFKSIPVGENLLRIQIGFSIARDRANTTILRNGIFEFITVTRYKDQAKRIIDLYSSVYDTLIRIFNVTLDSIRVKFFVPDFSTLMSIGGYVPFSGGKLGDIHINLIFTRYMEGYLEVVALHELVHHFLWKVGVSPEKLLWFHEGVAQYLSIEIAERMGYEGVRAIKREITESIKSLGLTARSNIRFLAEWTPYFTPRSLNILYTSAYYVVSELAKDYGGFEYYAKFFRLAKGVNLESNTVLCYYLSLAANRSLFEKFNQWGFNLPDIYTYWPLIIEVKRTIDGINPVNPFLQPFKKMAEAFYWAVVSGQASANEAFMLLSAALFIARNVTFIALLTYSCMLFLTILLLALRFKRKAI